MIPQLTVKDLRNDPTMPSMDDLRRAKIPSSMLDENVIAPRNTIPGTSGEPASDLKQVFLVQVTFVTGGLLLTLVGQHNAMDMIGQGQVIHLLAKACRNEPITKEELSSGNLRRRNIVPLLDDSYKQGPEIAHQIVKPAPAPPTSDSAVDPLALPSPSSSWADFSFLPTALTSLKAFATKSISHPSGYISTDDALTAFLWQAIARVRLLRLDPTIKTTIARAVDVRRYLNIPQAYPGLLQNMTYCTNIIQNLVQKPLGEVASQLRMQVDPKTSSLCYHSRALATFLDRSPEKTNSLSQRHLTCQPTSC